jgi:predicted nucleic acid-binding Zn ribbon protein
MVPKHYQILNLQPTATADEIRAAYHRERARLLSNGETENGLKIANELKALDEAYGTLADTSRRMAYDRALNTGAQNNSLVPMNQLSAIGSPETHTLLVQQACSHCQALIPAQATICSGCGKQLTRPCPHCGQATPLGQIVCNRCNTIVPEYDQRRFTETVIMEKRIQEERYISKVRAETLEATHTANRRAGLIFWFVVSGLCFSLSLLSILTYELFERFF